MKKILCTLVSFALSGSVIAAPKKAMPHLDPEMTGAEYARILEASPKLRALGDRRLDPILKMGKRNLEWLNKINEKRPATDKISFSTPENTAAYPIDAPKIYNPELIQKTYDELLLALPAPMKSVLVSGMPMTDQLPVAEGAYKAFGLKVDRVYQSAARWLMMEPYLSYLSGRRKDDIRGYYFLSNLKDLDTTLRDYDKLEGDQKANVTEALVGVCYNTERSDSECAQNLASSAKRGDVKGFYERYSKKSVEIYNGFYDIPRSRSDVTWTSANPNVMSIPFLNPKNQAVYDYLQYNIEDEWKWNGWQLKLDFKDSGSWNMTHVEFEPGVTPHVDGLGGSTITMDANAPLTEWDVQWTIRHEYGHVLGFPDCYIEFYVPRDKVIVNYQIDTTNLMCSRRGKLQQKHFDELKRVYFR